MSAGKLVTLHHLSPIVLDLLGLVALNRLTPVLFNLIRRIHHRLTELIDRHRLQDHEPAVLPPFERYDKDSFSCIAARAAAARCTYVEVNTAAPTQDLCVHKEEEEETEEE